MQSLGGLPAPSLRWEAGSTVVPWASLTTRTPLARTRPAPRQERPGEVLPDVNSCKLLSRGSLAGVADTPDHGGPHGRGIAAGATCVAPAKARGDRGSGTRRGCHSRHPSTTTASAAPPGPGRSCQGARTPLALQTTLIPAARRGGGVLKGADARRDSPARRGTGCHGTRSLGPVRGILGCAKPQLRQGTAKAPRPRGLGGATGPGPPGVRGGGGGGGGGGRRGRSRAPKPPRRLLIFCFLPPFGLQRQLLQPQTRGRRRHRAA